MILLDIYHIFIVSSIVLQKVYSARECTFYKMNNSDSRQWISIDIYNINKMNCGICCEPNIAEKIKALNLLNKSSIFSTISFFCKKPIMEIYFNGKEKIDFKSDFSICPICYSNILNYIKFVNHMKTFNIFHIEEFENSNYSDIIPMHSLTSSDTKKIILIKFNNDLTLYLIEPFGVEYRLRPVNPQHNKLKGENEKYFLVDLPYIKLNILNKDLSAYELIYISRENIFIENL